MKKLIKITLLALAGLFVIGLVAGGSSGKARPAVVVSAPTITTAPASKTQDAIVATTTSTTTAAASSCDAVREALLTGSQPQINSAMAAVQADKTADPTAREYADYYLHRDATDAQLRQMDVSLIRMSCAG